MRGNIFRSNQIRPITKLIRKRLLSRWRSLFRHFECIAVKRFWRDRRQIDISVINFKVDCVPQFKKRVMSTSLNTFSPFNRYRVHMTHWLKTVNRRERSMLTLLKKRPPTVKKSCKICFSKTECFLMKMWLLFQILGSRRPRMKEFFVYLAKTKASRHSL